MPWVFYKETGGECGEGSHTETEVLAVMSDPEIAKASIPDEVVKPLWPNDERWCHKWRWDDDMWVYTAPYSSWRYVLKEFPMDVVAEVEK